MNQFGREEKTSSSLLEQLKSEERRWQDQVGNDLIEKSYQWEGSRYIYERQFEKITNDMHIKENSFLLEVGCGRGQFLSWIYKRFASQKLTLFGLDLSEGLADVKQKNNPDICWIVADGENLPFPESRFNIVVFNGSLHHMPDFDKALQEAFRVIAPEGHIFLFEPMSTGFSRLMHHLLDPFIFKKTQYESPVDIYCKDNFKFSRLREIITEAGFTYTHSWHDFLAYPLTGCYAGSQFSKSAGLMRVMASLEDTLQKIPVIRQVLNLFCWRLLIDIYRKTGG